MANLSPDRNPFMLMLNPEIVLAAVENSARLSQLNRHLCRPLDRPVLGAGKAEDETADSDDDMTASDTQ